MKMVMLIAGGYVQQNEYLLSYVFFKVCDFFFEDFLLDTTFI